MSIAIKHPNKYAIAHCVCLTHYVEHNLAKKHIDLSQLTLRDYIYYIDPCTYSINPITGLLRKLDQYRARVVFPEGAH